MFRLLLSYAMLSSYVFFQGKLYNACSVISVSLERHDYKRDIVLSKRDLVLTNLVLKKRDLVLSIQLI